MKCDMVKKNTRRKEISDTSHKNMNSFFFCSLLDLRSQPIRVNGYEWRVEVAVLPKLIRTNSALFFIFVT